MNKSQIFLALIVGIHIGIRLPAAKKAAEQFKNSVGSQVVEYAAKYTAEQINNAIFSGYTVTGKREEK